MIILHTPATSFPHWKLKEHLYGSQCENHHENLEQEGAGGVLTLPLLGKGAHWGTEWHHDLPTWCYMDFYMMLDYLRTLTPVHIYTHAHVHTRKRGEYSYKIQQKL